MINHIKMQKQLIEIGRKLGFVATREFRTDVGIIDVAWILPKKIFKMKESLIALFEIENGEITLHKSVNVLSVVSASSKFLICDDSLVKKANVLVRDRNIEIVPFSQIQKFFLKFVEGGDIKIEENRVGVRLPNSSLIVFDIPNSKSGKTLRMRLLRKFNKNNANKIQDSVWEVPSSILDDILEDFKEIKDKIKMETISSPKLFVIKGDVEEML